MVIPTFDQQAENENPSDEKLRSAENNLECAKFIYDSITRIMDAFDTCYIQLYELLCALEDGFDYLPYDYVIDCTEDMKACCVKLMNAKANLIYEMIF